MIHDTSFLYIVCIGFFAQVIDGAMGMAYGVTTTTFLLGMGFQPALITSSVHISEVFTTLVSGVTHFGFGNIHAGLFKKLVIPGIIGGILGAYVITHISGEVLKPVIAVYLFIMGGYIFFKAFKKQLKSLNPRQEKIIPLAIFGGFIDSVGGGGWGPIITSTLIGRGHTPRFVIGSVNAAEFFVTIVQAGAFVVFLQTVNWNIIGALLLGGIIGAPFGAFITKKLPLKALMILVSFIIIFMSLRTLSTIFLQ